MDAQIAAYLPASLIVDIPIMDEQHAALFARLAAMKTSCLNDGRLPDGVAEELFSVLREHCDAEEALAQEAKLDFSAHAKKHEEMLHGMEKALHDLHNGRIEIFGLLRYIGYWLERHIADEDRHLAIRLHEINHWQHENDPEFRRVPFAALPPHAVPVDYSRL